MIFEARTGKSPRQNNRRSINRRRKQSQHLLDVNIRSDKARSHRNQKIILFCCKLLIAVAMVVGVVFGCRYGLDRMFFANPNYAITQIDVENEGTLPRQQILAAANLRLGTNIFSINLPAARMALLEIPQVEDAQIQRVLPDALKIIIAERHPVAWLAGMKTEGISLDHSRALMIDASGVVLKTRSVLPEYLRLPIISGVSVDGLSIGKKIVFPEVLTALTLIQKTTNTLAGRFDIEQIDVANGYCLEVRDREHITVRLGFADLDTQLQRLRMLLDYCDVNQKKMETVNLMVQKNVPVTFVQLESADNLPITEKAADSKTPVRKALPISPSNKKKNANGKG